MKLFNTLTKQKEEFKQRKGKPILMYNCGPTVYDRVHIGNLLSFVFADTLRRTFEYFGYEVKQVMNITDIGHLSSDGDDGDDKMTKALKKENLPLSMQNMLMIGRKYAEYFRGDLTALNILTPHVMPFASDHVEDSKQIIEKLIEKGLTYTTSDGLYFDTTKIDDYGKLGGITNDNETQSRIGENTEKKSLRDFALWKFNTESGFEAPWGHGFPGWHIECSGMSKKHLGDTIDVHTGGIDLAPVHHNNEIAQSENANGKKPFVRFWLHTQFLRINNAKMSKSTGNFYTLESIMNKGFDPLALRYLFLGSHYRSSLNFTEEALLSSQNAYHKLITKLASMPDGGSPITSIMRVFDEYLADDLDTPKCLALLHTISNEFAPADIKATILKMDNVLGLNLKQKSEAEKEAMLNIPQNITELARKRDLARRSKDFESADKIRLEIEGLGYTVLDMDDGFVLKKR